MCICVNYIQRITSSNYNSYQGKLCAENALCISFNEVNYSLKSNSSLFFKQITMKITLKLKKKLIKGER